MLNIIHADYSSMEILESFIRESVMMKNFDHPNVLHILGVGLDPDNGLPFIVLPFMANGNLQMYLKSKRSKATSVNQLPEVNTYAIATTDNINFHACISYVGNETKELA